MDSRAIFRMSIGFHIGIRLWPLLKSLYKIPVLRAAQLHYKMLIWAHTRIVWHVYHPLRPSWVTGWLSRRGMLRVAGRLLSHLGIHGNIFHDTEHAKHVIQRYFYGDIQSCIHICMFIYIYIYMYLNMFRL